MLSQLQTTVIVVGVHPHYDLSFRVENDGVVVLTHFTLEGDLPLLRVAGFNF